MGNSLSTVRNMFCCGGSTSHQPVTSSPTPQPRMGETVDALSTPSTSNPQNSQSDEIDLDNLIHHINHFLSAIDPKELMSSLLGEAQSEALAALKGIGKLNWAAAGLLVLAHVVERFEKISSNKKECLDLLKAMSNLAKIMRQLKNRRLKREMDDKLYEAVVLIAQGAIICCSQMKMKMPYGMTGFCLLRENAEDLVELRSRIDCMHRDLNIQIDICVLDKLDSRVKNTSERIYPEFAVGIEEQVKQVTDLLELGSAETAVAVVVHGFGGAGKTIVADAVVTILNLESYKYSKINLNENYQKPDIGKLQTKILQDLTGRSQPDIREFRSGQRDLDFIIQTEPVLIYIDNVLEKDDLEKLLPVSLGGSRKIRLLLTARDIIVSEVLKNSCTIEFHSMEPLSKNSATELLRKKRMDKAFKANQIRQIEEIAEKCRSSPLILNVVAGYLSRRDYDDDAFERVFQWFDTGEPFSLKEQERKHDATFGLAFGDLAPTAQDAFLDVCYFFYRWDSTVVERIVGTEELKTLEDAAFVRKELNRVGVHDVLVAFGRSRGIEKTEGLRLKSTKDVSMVLEDTENANKIKGIWLLENKELFQLSAKVLDQMHRSLRVLALGDWTSITDGKCNKTFHNLRLFQAGDVPCLPFTVSTLPRLTFLENFCGQDMGLNASTISPTLGVMKLSRRNHCRKIEIHPQTFEKLKNLRILELRGFPELNLETFPVFRKLTHLNLRECVVVEIPNSLGNSDALQSLNLSNCTRLETLPECIGDLRHLEILNLQGCIHLKKLPESIGFSSSLADVNLRFCRNIEELPGNFGLLNSLKFLNLGFCANLKKLPGNFGNLTSLAWLDLSYCEELRSVPHSIGQSTSLRIRCCYQLMEIPEEFCDSVFVELVDLAECTSLRQLPFRFPELRHLRRMELSFCESLLRLPDCFYKLSCLEVLDLNGCSQLEDLCSEFERIPSLVWLDMSECKSLNGIWMECVAQIQSLRSVRIKGSYWLQKQWEQIKNDKGEWHFLINTGQEQVSEDMNITKSFLREASSAFFKSECLLIDSTGKQVGPTSSFIPDGTLVLLFGPRSGVRFLRFYDWKLVSDNLKELRRRSQEMQIIYIDTEKNPWRIFNKLPDGSLRLIPPTDVGAILAMTVIWVDDAECILIRTAVETDSEGHKRFSKWENISILLDKIIFDTKFGETESCLHIKRLVAGTAPEVEDCNIELLRTVLVTKETDFLLTNTLQQVKVDHLKGKQILLFISRMEVSEYEISVMKEVYLNRCHNFEIVWVPGVDVDDTWGCYVTNVRNILWLAIPNPWLIDNAVRFFEDYSHFNFWESILVVVDGHGRIVNENAMRMVKRWGVEAYPFTPDKKKELEMAEQLQINLKASIEFLLQNFDYALPKVSVIGKLMCLLGGDPHEIPYFVSKLNSAFRGIKDNFNFIYVGRSDRRIEDIDGEAAMLEKSREAMSGSSLAMRDVSRFWDRAHDYLFKKETLAMEESEKTMRLRRLLVRLEALDRYSPGVWMIVLDEDGDEVTTGRGMELVEELCEDGLKLELSQTLESSGVGGLKLALKRRFNDHVILRQHHPRHSLIQFQPHQLRWRARCDMCEDRLLNQNFNYRCVECENLDICEICFHKLQGMH